MIGRCPRCGRRAALVAWPFCYVVTRHGSRVGWPEACRACIAFVAAAVAEIPS